MVKFANKAKGRPTKRKTLKVKYKIERKVKQHNKRVKKEAGKLKGKGLKHKGQARSDYLPNMFPFKHQILEEAKRAMPKVIVAQTQILDQNKYGLINLQNRSSYLPKPKDNLIKKYVTNLQQLLQNIQVVVELLQVRNPFACIDQDFRSKCKANNIQIISVLTKIDTVKGTNYLQLSEAKVQQKCEKLFKFSTDHKIKSSALEQIINELKNIGEGKVLVAGKALTGKHTFISSLAKHIGKYQESSCQLNLIKITSSISLIDSPYKITDKSGYPLFNMPNPILEQSLLAQEEHLIRKIFVGDTANKGLFDRNTILQHFVIQDFTNVSDLLTKIGKAWKIFGKGGSVDVSRVRSKVLSDWFNGKLSSLLSH